MNAPLRSTLVAIVGGTVLSLSAPGVAGAQAPCPAPNAADRQVAESLIQHDVAEGAGPLSHVDPSNLQSVTKNKDCKRMERVLVPTYSVKGPKADQVVSYFQVEDRFIAVISPKEEPAVVRHAPQVLVVFDPDLAELGTFLIG